MTPHHIRNTEKLRFCTEFIDQRGDCGLVGNGDDEAIHILPAADCCDEIGNALGDEIDDHHCPFHTVIGIIAVEVIWGFHLDNG